MSKNYKGLAKHTLIYGVGSVMVATGGFLLIPVYTHALSAAEYGTLEILNRIADIVLLVMFLGMRQSFIRIYFDRNSEGWGDRVAATFLVFCICSSLLIAAFLYPWAGNALASSYNDPSLDGLFSLLLISAAVTMFYNVVMAYLQARTWSKIYVLTSFLYVLIFVGLTMYFLLVEGLGLRGALLANISSAGLIALIGSTYLIFVTRLYISKYAFVEMLKFGFPYLPAAVFMYVINNADRYFLSIHESMEGVGIYALAFKIAMLGIIFLIEPFLKIWTPYLFQIYRDAKGPKMIADVFRYFCIVCVGFATFVAIIAPFILPIISGEEFQDAALLIPPLAIASIFYAAQHITDAGILISKKTSVKPIIFGLGAAAAVGLNMVFIPWLGMYGATIASSLTFLILLVTTILFATHFHSLPYSYTKFVFTILAGVVTYGSSTILVYVTHGEALLLVSAGSFIIYPIIVWFGPILTDEEKSELRRLIATLRARVRSA